MPLVKFSKTIAAIALALAICGVYPTNSVRAAAKDDNAAVKTLFGSNCKSCHGVDGSGTPIGQSLNAPDLRSETVQKQTDDQLAEAVSSGKGNMPPFKNALSPDQIHSLVQYVRQLGGAKSSPQK
ncbi:MAG: c-type cytochrome [Terriglobales bacterium]